MQQINGLTSYPNQQLTVKLPDGSVLQISMLYRQSQYGWFFTALNWNNSQWVENGRRIVTHPNMLRQYKDLIPFGLACFTVNNREPTNQQDFVPPSAGVAPASALYLLSATEVQEVETLISSLKNA